MYRVIDDFYKTPLKEQRIWAKFLYRTIETVKDTCSYLKVAFGKELRTRWTASGYYLKWPELRVGEHLSSHHSTLTTWWNLHSKCLAAFRSKIAAREMADRVISVRFWFTIFPENFVMRPHSAESIPPLPAVTQTGNRLKVFTSVLQQADVDWSFNYYRPRSRTLICFESLPDHTHHDIVGTFFFLSFCVHTLLEEEISDPDLLIFHSCTSGP